MENKFNPEDIQKILKNVDTKNLLKQQYLHTPKVTNPEFNFTKKEEPKPKRGIEAWYEKHTGKITIGLAAIALIEAFIIFLLSK